MAKIVHSEAAPSEAVHYSLAGVEFDLGGRKRAFETNDPTVIGNAEAHPWLKVEHEAVEAVKGDYVTQLRPEDDALSAVNSVANNPEAAPAPEVQDSETVVETPTADTDEESKN